MKRKILKFVPFAILPLLLLTSCNLEANPDGPVLMTAINYNEKQRIVYSLDDPYETPAVRGQKRKYTKGDYKPVWEYIQNKLGITLLEHQAAANSGEKKSVAYFRDNWLNSQYADISMGTVNAITKYSVAGSKETILDLKPYLLQTEFDEETGEIITGKEGPLPNLAKFLKDNPGLMTSIMTAKHSHPEQAAVYYVPYLDGFDDTERMIMVRHDYITKLLDGDPTGFDKNSNKILGQAGTAQYSQHYTNFIKDDNYEILLPNVVISGVNEGTIDKSKHEGASNYKYTKKKLSELTDKRNIIEQQNELINQGKATSAALAQQFQTYIQERYFNVTGQDDIFTKNSDLFLGWKACFDTDELIALMRLVKVSSWTLYPNDPFYREMVTWFPTEWTNMRSSDLYRFGGQIFGVRGPESRTGYLYLNGNKDYGEYGKADRVHDCRGDREMVEMIKNLQALYQEGLLMQDFDSISATGTNNKLFYEQLILDYKKEEGKNNKKYHGFLEYAYVNAESKLNEIDDDDKKTEDGCLYAPMIGAVTKWDTDFDENGSDQSKWHQRDTYMQFTESWTSAKTSALCLNAKLAKTPQKLANAFKLINYIFSNDGKAVYNYGPSDDGYEYFYPGTYDSDGNFNPDTSKLPQGEKGYVEYKGKRVPQITKEAEEQNKKIDGVNRQRVGATLPFGFEKLNGMVFQQIRKASQGGVIKVNKAIECGSFRHTCIRDVYEEYPDLKLEADNKKAFYKIVPSSFFLTDGQNTDIARILDKSKLGSMYTDDNQSQFNIWDDYVMGGKASSAPTLDNYLTTVNGAWECQKLVTYYQDAYELVV